MMKDMVSPLIAHLSTIVPLDASDLAMLAAMAGRHIAAAPPHVDLITEGARHHGVKLLLDGWAMRCKLVPDGRRQILSFMLPGDISDAGGPILDRADHTICTLTHVHYVELRAADFEALTAASPRIARALRWSDAIETAMARRWIVNLGLCSAAERIAHLFCEIATRLTSRGIGSWLNCPFPLTQSEIAEATGLTSVHVNRTLQHMRRDGLIELRGKELSILDPSRLAWLGAFDPAYLFGKDGVAARPPASKAERTELSQQLM